MGEKQKEKWEKQVREKETPTFTISLARARALARLFSFWPCDEDSCFSTSWEICCKFPFAVQCSARHDLNKIRKSKSRMKSWTKSRRNVSTLLEAFPMHASVSSMCQTGPRKILVPLNYPILLWLTLCKISHDFGFSRFNFLNKDERSLLCNILQKIFDELISCVWYWKNHQWMEACSLCFS